jgi:hypothetical protein
LFDIDVLIAAGDLNDALSLLCSYEKSGVVENLERAIEAFEPLLHVTPSVRRTTGISQRFSFISKRHFCYAPSPRPFREDINFVVIAVISTARSN